MKGKASVNWPLFPEEPGDVWESLDSQTQQQAESLIARWLATYIEKSVAETNKLSNTTENQL